MAKTKKESVGESSKIYEKLLSDISNLCRKADEELEELNRGENNVSP